MKDDIFEKQQLIIKFFNEEASDAEKAMLNEWLDLSEDNREAFNRLYDQEYLKENMQYLREIETSEKQHWKTITQNIRPASYGRLIPFWKKWTAAAVVLVMVGVAWYALINQTRPGPVSSSTAIRTKADVPPGGDRAILTLANGSTILLDSAANGSLARQGNMRVIKLSNGQLSYNPSPNLEDTPQDDRHDEQASPGEPSRLAGETEGYNTITTPKGGQYQIVLPDGTKVWLNAASSLRFSTSFNKRTREIYITGEAYLEVSPHRPSSGTRIPFQVKTGQLTIDVLGTSFNINAYEDETFVKTTLLEGSVKVNKGAEQVFIKPGQQAKLNKTKNEMTVSENINTEETLAWKNGLFHSESTDITGLLRQIARWYDVDIIYNGTASTARFTGTLSRKLNLSSLLKILELSDVHIKYETINNRIKITAS